MPIHNWTRVHAGIFHDFHHWWIEEIKRALNRGRLPRGYDAMAQQISGGMAPDVLTLNLPVQGSLAAEPAPDGIALATAPPKVRFRVRGQIDISARKAKAVVIHHRGGHRVIAMVELVSPGNKGIPTKLSTFVQKAEQALRGGVHLRVVDLFPPTPRDPQGIHRAIWGEAREGDLALPDDKPLTCVSYVGFPIPEVFLEPVAVGDALPDPPCSSRRRSTSPSPSRPAIDRPGRSCRRSGARSSPLLPPANGRKESGRGRKRKE
jgi:hypothetical protein